MPITIKSGAFKYKDPATGNYKTIDVVGQSLNYDSEAYAIGTRKGVPVSPSDPTYQNNSKYYAEKIKQIAQDVQTSDLGLVVTTIQDSLNTKVDQIVLDGLELKFFSSGRLLGSCEIANNSIPYEKLSKQVQDSINRLNDVMLSSVYDPLGYGKRSQPLDPYTYSDQKNTSLKEQIRNNDTYNVDNTNYNGLIAALTGVLTKAKSYGDSLIDGKLYTIDNTNYTGVVAALQGVLSKAKIYGDNLIVSHTFTIDSTNYQGVSAALDGVLSKAKAYGDSLITKTYTVDNVNYNGIIPAISGILAKAKEYSDSIVTTREYTVNGTVYSGLIDALEGVVDKVSNEILTQNYTVDGTTYSSLTDALEGILNKAKDYRDALLTTQTYTIDNEIYTGLINALEGILTKAKDYTDLSILNYEPFKISVVSTRPSVGAARTFYLIKKDDNTYEKWWYIEDGEGNKIWDQIGGGSSTKVVTALPTGSQIDTNVDYILKSNDGCMYYKYIDNEWKVITGSSAAIVSELPQAANANEFTDYYVANGDTYVHYRFYDNEFVQIGSAENGYSTEDVDGFISALDDKITTNAQDISSLNDITTTLRGRVNTLQQTVNALDTTTYEYEATYGTATVGGVEMQNVYTLYKKEEGSEEKPEIVSRFVIQGGGGGGGTSASTLTVTRVTPSPYIVTKEDSILLQYNYSSVNSAEEDVAGTYVWKIGNRVIGTGACVKGLNTFDVTEFITNIGETSVNLTVSDEGGSVALRTFKVQKIDLYIESNFKDKLYVELGQPVRFNYIPHGNIPKTVHFKLDGQEETEVTSISNETLERIIPAQEYGSHLLEVWMTATINNTLVTTPKHVYKDIIWYDPEEGTKPVIGCIYRNDYYGTVKIKQYDSLPIVYYVYDPATGRPSVKKYLDDVLVDTVVVRDNEDIWNFQSGEIGNHTLRLECKNTIVTIVIQVQQLGIDVSPVTGGLEIDFNPSGITNTSENRVWSNDRYAMTVSDNFDWSGGGYQIDNNGDSYFLIKAGSYVTFNYQMFSGGTEGNLTRRNGGEMKVSFMVENVQDVNAVWLSNVETTTVEAQDSETGQTITKTVNLGLQMSAHEGWLKTNNAKTATEVTGDEKASNTYLYLPYSEQDIIDIDVNIDPISGGANPSGFILAYEDGVPSKAYVYDGTDRFYQQSPKPIKIGSDRCDIRIYRLKIYSRSLSTTEVMRNFIADSRNAITMLNKYNRNSVYYDTEHQVYTPYKDKGILDPERLAERVPNVKILMLETDHFTVNKKTFVKSSLRCIHAPGGTVYQGDPYEDNWYFENGYHSGQGTTSDNYGQSGRNVDFLFNCDGTHKPSDKVNAEANYISKLTKGYLTENAYTETCTDWKGDTAKISLTRESVPNNFFNLKVNIASSENVNNWLLQKRYNDFLPYISPAKKRDSRIKNDMEFVPAILFLRETNTEQIVKDGQTEYTQHTEFNDTNWHFYALGNLGDSKKTDYTRAYDPTDMNEFTIEISDNTKNNATFQTGVYIDSNGRRQIEDFTITEKDGKQIVLPSVQVFQFKYPITIAEWNDSRNYRHWTLQNEDFDGDHSFEPRYACCGDYRDGKLVNDTTGHGNEQVAKNNEVWKAFYRWVVTSTDAQFTSELDQWCVRSAVEFFYAFTHFHTMMDNRAKNTFWHFAKTGEYRKVSRPVAELIHVYCELQNDEYVPTTDTQVVTGKTYYTQYAFDIWDYDNDTALGINNNGELIFPYGKEDFDYNIDGDPTSGWVFNGADSVFWCRLRDLCSSEIANTFSNVVSSECFNANNLINQFDTMQDCYPEEIWRIDFERKYIRTFTGESIDNSKTEGKQAETFLKNMMQGKKKYQRRQWIKDQEMYFGTKYLMSNVTGDSNRITFRCYNPGPGAAVSPNYSLRITPFSDMYVSAMFGNGDTNQQRAKAGEEVVLNFSVSTATDTQVTIYAANRIAGLNDLSACYITTPNFSSAVKLKKLVLGNTTTGYNNARLQSLTLGNNKMLEELDVRNCRALSGGLNLANSINLLKLYAENTQISAVTFATNGKVQIAHLPATIETLVMRGLNNLQDFQASLAILYSLTLEGGTLDNKAIVEDTLDTLYELRLDNINWTLEENDILQNIYGLESLSGQDSQNTFLTGTVHLLSPIKSGALANYQKIWPDLIIDTSQSGIIQQYLVRYINDDENQTVLYEYYVDAGTLPIDPYWEGLISEPTKPKDSRYIYTFGERDIASQYKKGTGWDENLEKRVFGDTVILAQYTTEIRRFNVQWYALQGQEPLYELNNIAYGVRAEYEGDIPQRKDSQATGVYYLFKDWDLDTGYITDDLKVYAVWEQYRGALPTIGKNMKNMTPIEIYAISKADQADTYWDDGDYFDLTLGKDFDYSNVQSITIGKDISLPNTIEKETYASSTGYYFDGSQYSTYRSNIKLFSESIPSFTIAIDFQFGEKVANNDYEVLLSNYEIDQNAAVGSAQRYLKTGFRIYRYNNNVYLETGGTVQNSSNYILIGTASQRDIVVIRYNRNTPNNLYVYGSYFAPNYQQTNVPSIVQKTFSIASFRASEEPLSFGGTPFQITTGNQAIFVSSCKGILHWCKIWYTDLGVNNARALASWPREKIRMEYYGAGRYYRANAQTVEEVKSKASWITNAALGTFHQRAFYYYTSSNQGGNYGVSFRGPFLQQRIWPTLPNIWQSIISTVSVPFYNASSNTSISQNFYLPAYLELGANTTSAQYTQEITPATTPISWMTSNFTRAKFPGYNRRYTEQVVECEQEPTNYYYTEYPYGTIWYNTSNGYYYILVEGSLALHYNIPNDYPVSSLLTKGGAWLQAVSYDTRSSTGSYYYHYTVRPGGSFASDYYYSTYYGGYRSIVFGFSI